MFNNKTILLTGGTGSWGRELTSQLLPFNPKEIRIFSRNEDLQVSMSRAFNQPNLKFIIGDISDYYAVENACRDVDIVFHLAALKHVTVCENQPDEAFKTNVLGTKNIIEASIKYGVKKVINVSTDKAVDPINFYGMTKAYTEKLIVEADKLSESTRFVCVRGGNVLGSNGSVVPFFKQQIKEKEQISLTSSKMTRFFQTIPETVSLLINATGFSVGGEIIVFSMKACYIKDLARILIDNLTTKPIEIVEIGIRQGEKFHEELISTSEASNTYLYNDKYFVILPSNPTSLQKKYISKDSKVNFRSYASYDYLMSSGEVLSMLKSGGFL